MGIMCPYVTPLESKGSEKVRRMKDELRNAE
jgi:hypothetical protein